MELVLKKGDQTIGGSKSFSERIIAKGGIRSDANVGTVGADTVTVEEYGDGLHHVSVLTLDNFVVGALGAAAADLCLVPITPLYSLPAGIQLNYAAHASIDVAATGTAVTPEIGLGSVAGDGSVEATLGAAGATFEDVLEGFDVADTETSAEVISANASLNVGKAADSKDIYLNAAATWNADNTGNLTVSGTVIIVWDSIV